MNHICVWAIGVLSLVACTSQQDLGAHAGRPGGSAGAANAGSAGLGAAGQGGSGAQASGGLGGAMGGSAGSAAGGAGGSGGGSAAGAGAGGDSGSGGNGGAGGNSAPDGTLRVAGGPVTVVWSGEHRDGATSTTSLSTDFYVDIKEVTVGQFRAWADAGFPAPCPGQACSLDVGGPYAASMLWYPGDDAFVTTTQYRTSECGTPVVGVSNVAGAAPTYNAGDESFPMNCVTFAQAAALCAFRGMRLLTQVEWYRVASGGQQRVYPWGSQDPSSCDQVVFNPLDVPLNPCGFPKASGAGLLDVSRDGVLELGGSLAEWVWGAPIAEFEPASTLPTDFVGPPRTTDRQMVRGGSFIDRKQLTRASQGIRQDTTEGYTTVGVRCAKSALD